MANSKKQVMKQPTSNAVSTAVVVQGIQAEAKPLIKKLEKIDKITTADDYAKAADTLKALKEYGQIAEAKQKSIVDPMKQAIKEVQSLFKPFEAQIEGIQANIKGMMLIFMDAQLQKQKQLDEKLESGAIKTVATYHKKTTELQYGTASAKVRTIKVLTIDDVTLIPREYMVPDEVAIKKALLDGLKVKGCRLEEKANIAI